MQKSVPIIPIKIKNNNKERKRVYKKKKVMIQ